MKVEISIPESLDEITLEQYQRFATIDPNADKDFLARKMLEVFCGVQDTLKVKLKDVEKVYQSLSESLEVNCPFVPRFNLGDKEFGFIPRLDDITFGEYIDLDSLFTWPNMHRALAILYRPVTKSYANLYDIEEYESSEKYSELMKKAPASIAIGAVVFFWTLSNDLVKAFLSKQAKKETIAHDHNSMLSTDGTQLLTLLQEVTLQNKRQLPDYAQANVYINYLTSKQKEEWNIRNLIKEDENIL